MAVFSLLRQLHRRLEREHDIHSISMGGHNDPLILSYLFWVASLVAGGMGDGSGIWIRTLTQMNNILVYVVIGPTLTGFQGDKERPLAAFSTT
jgi:hypothetical protein